MTIQEFKRINKLLTRGYDELEEEALRDGVNIVSSEYDQLITTVRDKILESQGFTLKDYRITKEKVEGGSSSVVRQIAEETETKVNVLENHLRQKFEAIFNESMENIPSMVRDLVIEYRLPPQITNEIVKEITVPQITKEEFSDEELQKEIQSLKDSHASLDKEVKAINKYIDLI